jgi:hypothetical protein
VDSSLLFLPLGGAMLKTVLGWGEILLWIPLIGVCVVLVSFFPEYRRPPGKEMTEKNVWRVFAFLSRQKAASQIISPKKAREKIL